MLPDVGLAEILVVALVALLVMKPEDVPVVMRKAGVAFAYLQRFVSGMLSGWKEKAGL